MPKYGKGAISERIFRITTSPKLIFLNRRNDQVIDPVQQKCASLIAHAIPQAAGKRIPSQEIVELVQDKALSLIAKRPIEPLFAGEGRCCKLCHFSYKAPKTMPWARGRSLE